MKKVTSILFFWFVCLQTFSQWASYPLGPGGAMVCGWACYTGHVGQDWQYMPYNTSYGRDIYAVADGTVVYIITGNTGCHDPFTDGWWGHPTNMIIIKHTNGKFTRSLHIKNVAPGIAVGTAVSCGQLIAYVGNVGSISPCNNSNPQINAHLHFEVGTGRVGGSLTGKYNPASIWIGCFPPSCCGPAVPPAPSVSSNNCGDKTLTHGAPPSGTTYYWQGTSCGTSTTNPSATYTVNSSGTYYLRAKNSNGVWSACSSTSVTVDPVPADPPIPTTTTNQCGPQTLTRGNPPSGESYYWQGTSCGTTISNGSASTFLAQTTGTYYLRARTSAGCWSNACSSVAVAVAPTPAAPPIPSVSSNSCGPITLTMGAAPPGQTYYWEGNNCGISMTDTASTHIASVSGVYYLRSLSNQACWSNCSSAGVTISDCPSNLSVSIGPCPNEIVKFTWLNSNNNWSLQVSLDSAFGTFSSKSAPNVTLLNAPSGFTPALTIQANATYYWRIATGNIYTYGPTFAVPFCDIIVPVTVITPFAHWQDSSFIANFIDSDDSLGTGLGKSYYRVIDFNGTEWNTNRAHGFANDNFDNTTLNADWTNYSGTWTTNAGYLIQNNQAVNNSNLSIPLTQSLSGRYLYHWNAKIEGGGSNRQAGFHFFSDSASLPNRGNSYFVMFNLDENKLQFYKTNNDIPVLVKSKNYSFASGQFYDFKLIYDRNSGKMDLYINNTLTESWQDANPINTGKYVSFRTSNSRMMVNYFKAFRSRLPSVIVNVGAGNTNDIRFENTLPTLCAGKIESIVADSAGNLSTVAEAKVNVDRTGPSPIAFVNDGPGADITVTTDSTGLTANWAPSSDPNSGIAKYHYSIGISPGDTSICGATDNFIQLLGAKSPLQLVINQIYYFNIWSENGAGLLSTVTCSNGQKVIPNTTNIEEENSLAEINLFPNPFDNETTLNYKLLKSEKIQVVLYDLAGRKIVELKNENQGAGDYKIKIDGNQLSLKNGLYLVVFKTEKTSAFIKIEFKL